MLISYVRLDHTLYWINYGVMYILGHYKLDHSFPSTTRMPFEPPPTFSIIALIFYYNKNIDDVIVIFNIIYGLFHVRSSCKLSL